MDTLKFEDLPAAMEEVLKKLSQVEEELKNIKENFQPKEPEELMSRKDTAEYLSVDPSTLWNWTNRQKLIAYGIGGRVYYKRSEIDSSLIKFSK